MSATAGYRVDKMDPATAGFDHIEMAALEVSDLARVNVAPEGCLDALFFHFVHNPAPL
jgi:hypothetical protein